MTTAAQTKEHEEDKHTGIRQDTILQVGSKVQKQKKRTQGVYSNKSSRLCYKAEPGTLSHHLPSSSSALSSATVSSVTAAAAVEPPLREQINENETKSVFV